jgi:hypothetical protein
MTATPSNSPPIMSSTLAMTLAIVIVVALIAAIIGISFLPQPYYAIGQVVVYAGLVATIAWKLRDCLRLTKGTTYHQKLFNVVFWVVLGVLAVISHLGELFKTEDRDYIRLATNVAVYLALLFALELVEQLLKEVGHQKPAITTDSNAESTTPPNQPS